MKTIIEIVKGDITELDLDAIVNAANSSLRGGGGVDGAIHRKGGPEIMRECREIGHCSVGQAVITTGGKLKAKYIIHTVGPRYAVNSPPQGRLLYSAYYESLKLGSQFEEIRSIAFPSISTGVYGYPFLKASKIALNAIYDFIKKDDHYEKVIFILYSERDYRQFIELANKIE
jgi:O-acetyl-ADP-ribose deacetylase (regulator of RNase III)